LSHVPFVHRFHEPDNLQLAGNERRKNREKRDRGSESTTDLASVINGAVTELLSRAASGDNVAAGHLLRELSIAVGKLEGLVHRQKVICERLARKTTQWPVLATRNPSIYHDMPLA
jgi:hypothetical protein